jgi:hypothetical protein
MFAGHFLFKRKKGMQGYAVFIVLWGAYKGMTTGQVIKDENYLYLTYYQIGIHALDQ